MLSWIRHCVAEVHALPSALPVNLCFSFEFLTLITSHYLTLANYIAQLASKASWSFGVNHHSETFLENSFPQTAYNAFPSLNGELLYLLGWHPIITSVFPGILTSCHLLQ